MKEKIDELMREIEAFTADKAEDVEQFRIKYLSRKGRYHRCSMRLNRWLPKNEKYWGRQSIR